MKSDKIVSREFWRQLKRSAPFFLYVMYRGRKIQDFLDSNSPIVFTKLSINSDKWISYVNTRWENRWSIYKVEKVIELHKYKGFYNLRRVVAFELIDYFVYFKNVFLLCDEMSKCHQENTYLMNIWQDTPYYGKIYSYESHNKNILSSEEDIDDSNPYSNEHYYQLIKNIVKSYPHLRKISDNCSGFFDNYPDGIIVSIDIANFFDNIPFYMLEKKLNSVIVDNPDSVNLIMKFLKSYDHKFLPNKMIGLPQDILSVSGILAHFYLYDIDIFILRELKLVQGEYVRFVDELTFFLPDKKYLGSILSKISLQLARNNLNINTSKTIILRNDNDVENYFLFNRFAELNDNRELGDAIQDTPNNINQISEGIIDLFNTEKTPDKALSLLKRFITILTRYRECREALTDKNLTQIFNFFERETFLLSLDDFYLKSLYLLKKDEDKALYIEKLKTLSEKYGSVYQKFKYSVDYVNYEISRGH